jgi:hypothetical protein
MEKLSGLSGCQAGLMGTIQFIQEEDCRGHKP